MIRLATSPEPHTVATTGSVLDMFKAKSLAGAPPHGPNGLHCSPGSKPDPEPNPEPDAGESSLQSDISPADWDALFNAVTARLQACSGAALLEPRYDHDHQHEHVAEHVPEHLPGTTGSFEETVSDCVVSLNLLHAALPRDWHQNVQHQ